MLPEIFDLIGAAFGENRFPLFIRKGGLEDVLDLAHGHPHDGMNVVLCQAREGRIFPGEDDVPGFGDILRGIPEGSVKVKDQHRLQGGRPPSDRLRNGSGVIRNSFRCIIQWIHLSFNAAPGSQPGPAATETVKNIL